MTKRLTTINHDHHHESEEIEEEILVALPANIFEASFLGEIVPQGFDSVLISLDGTVKADLSWRKEQEAAKNYVNQGFRIFWKIDLGLSRGLDQALGNRTQFLALTLSLEHFCKTLWKEFRKETVGLNLYDGSLDFSAKYVWDEEQIANMQEWMEDHFGSIDTFIQETAIEIKSFKEILPAKLQQSDLGKELLRFFCRDAMAEYLNLLTGSVPDTLSFFLMLDASEITSDFLLAGLLNKEHFPRFHLVVKRRHPFFREEILGGELAWESEVQEKGMIGKVFKESSFVKPRLGFCLPSQSLCRPSLALSLSQAFIYLQKQQKSFRIIPEVDLAAEWEGLDCLIIDTQLVNIQFKRKLQGFCAAGGTVVFVGESLHLAEEISFDEFFKIPQRN